MEIIIKNPTMHNILNSVWIPKRIIIFTFLLIVLINYIYTVYAYIDFYQFFIGSDGLTSCENIWICFFITFD